MKIWNPSSAEYEQFGGSTGIADLAEAIIAAPAFDAVNAMTSASWVSYTPTWTCDGTAPNLGNGTISGSYLAVPAWSMIHLQMLLVAGSTTTFGTNGWHFSLPSGISAADGLSVISGQAYDTSAFLGNTVSAGYGNGGTTFNVLINGNNNFVTNGNPFSWSTNDWLMLSGFLRVNGL